jgi:PhnB protein
MAVNYVPEGYRTVTPYLVIRGAAEAIEWYKKAFGAEDIARMPMPDGKLMHAEIKIGDSFIMMSDEFPEMGGGKSPQALGGSCCSLHLYVPDVDASFSRAVSAGAEAQMPPMDMFWGDRFSKLRDPFGHEWTIATHKEDVTPEEMERRAAEAATQMAGSSKQ